MKYLHFLKFGAKMAKTNKIGKTEELIAGYQEAKCLWNVLSPSYKDRNLRQMALTNLSEKFGTSGKLFWKQPLRGVVENGVLKILAKFLQNICKGVAILVKFQAKSWKSVTLLKMISQNTFLQLLPVLVSNTPPMRLIFAEIYFHQINFPVGLFWRMTILPYFPDRKIREILRRQIFAKTANSAKKNLAKINALKVYEN